MEIPMGAVPPEQEQPVNQQPVQPAQPQPIQQPVQPAPQPVANKAQETVTKKVMAVEVYNHLAKKKVILMVNMACVLLLAVPGNYKWFRIGLAAIAIGVNAAFLLKDMQYMKYLQNMYNIQVRKLKVNLN
jgi:hypothetical protein